MVAYTAAELRALAKLVEAGEIEVLRGTGEHTAAMLVVCKPRNERRRTR